MRSTPFVCHFGNITHDAGKALELLVGHLDAGQWVAAGVALGRLEELGKQLAATARLAGDALWEDSLREAE